MRKLWLGILAVAVLTAGASGAQARKLGYSDILGSWCGDNSKYVFTRQSLTVFWVGSVDRRVLPVKEWVFSETWINVKWKPKGNTVFAEFSKDGRNMAQRPNTTGDMGPRRPFHRCK
jgi:hypothetical protein